MVLSFFFNSRILQTGILQTGPNQFVENQKQNQDITGPNQDCAEVGRRNGIENQSQSSGRHTKFLNGIETTRIEIYIT